MIADVVIFTGIPKALSYTLPEGLRASVGCRVTAPVRNAKKTGVIVAIREGGSDDTGLKPLHAIMDEHPLITREMIDFIQWCSRYYHAGIGQCMSLAFPPYLRQGKTLLQEDDPAVFPVKSGTVHIGRKQKAILDAIPEEGMPMSRIKALFPGSTASIAGLMRKGCLEMRQKKTEVSSPGFPPIEYTPDQQKAMGAIAGAIDAGGFHTFVLHGITGSGKTEIYLAMANKVLDRGQSVLYLVPEISLTPQTVEMVKGRVPYEVAVFHSGLSPRERAREFDRVVRSGVRLVLGTRSAVFSPLTRLGLVIVDEEHDGSYKQEEGVPYNARDLSILRAKNNGAVVILGSATPSMETYVRPEGEQATLITMSSRVGPAELPKVKIVDMKDVKGPLSDTLLEEMRKTLAAGEQILLFINRRGFSAAMICPGCGKPLKCTRCDRSLTYHKARGISLCHWCGFTMKLPEICPACGCLDMRPVGFGTEKILQAVKDAFPDRRLMQMDSDEMSSSGRLSSALEDIRTGKVDIIVGTQMIAKGHDFPHLALVGVVHAEQLLHIPDFRAGERTFQQIVQVAGRAGRRRSDTLVVIQTLIPDHALIRAIADYDYGEMISAEQEIRKATGFPPYSFMARCVISTSSEKQSKDVSNLLASAVDVPSVELLGPAPAPVSFIRNRHRWHIILRSKNRTALHRAISCLEQTALPAGADIRIDVDPYTML
jgi:primosomal protein N' (replication factor Y)